MTVAPSSGLVWPYSFTVMVPLMIGSDPTHSSVTLDVVTFSVSFTAAADVPAIASTNANAMMNIKAFLFNIIRYSPIFEILNLLMHTILIYKKSQCC